jgi:hypothetical protein
MIFFEKVLFFLLEKYFFPSCGSDGMLPWAMSALNGHSECFRGINFFLLKKIKIFTFELFYQLISYS